MCICVYVYGIGPYLWELCRVFTKPQSKAPVPHMYRHMHISVFLLLSLSCPQDISGNNNHNNRYTADLDFLLKLSAVYLNFKAQP